MADEDARKLPGMIIRGNEPKQVDLSQPGEYKTRHKDGWEEHFQVYRDERGKTKILTDDKDAQELFFRNEQKTLRKLAPRGRNAPEANPKWLPPSKIDVDDLPVEVKRARRENLEMYLNNPDVPEKEKAYWRMRKRMFREDI